MKPPTSQRAACPDSDEADLLSADPLVFARLVGRYQHALFGFLGRMGFRQAEAEELAQEAFLRAWRNSTSFDPAKGRLSTWLFAIARNLALNALERRDHGPMLNERFNVDRVDRVEHADCAIHPGTPVDLPDPHPDADPVRRLEAGRQIEQLRSALLTLSADDRTAIALVYVRELSGDDAAQIMGCSAGAFRTRLSRARTRLIQTMQQVA